MNELLSVGLTSALSLSQHPDLARGVITLDLNLEASSIFAGHMADFGFHVCDRQLTDQGVCLAFLKPGIQPSYVEFELGLLIIPASDGIPAVRVAFRLGKAADCSGWGFFEGYSRIDGEWFGVLGLDVTFSMLVGSLRSSLPHLNHSRAEGTCIDVMPSWFGEGNRC